MIQACQISTIDFKPDSFLPCLGEDVNKALIKGDFEKFKFYIKDIKNNATDEPASGDIKRYHSSSIGYLPIKFEKNMLAFFLLYSSFKEDVLFSNALYFSMRENNLNFFMKIFKIMRLRYHGEKLDRLYEFIFMTGRHYKRYEFLKYAWEKIEDKLDFIFKIPTVTDLIHKKIIPYNFLSDDRGVEYICEEIFKRDNGFILYSFLKLGLDIFNIKYLDDETFFDYLIRKRRFFIFSDSYLNNLITLEMYSEKKLNFLASADHILNLESFNSLGRNKKGHVDFNGDTRVEKYGKSLREYAWQSQNYILYFHLSNNKLDILNSYQDRIDNPIQATENLLWLGTEIAKYYHDEDRVKQYNTLNSLIGSLKMSDGRFKYTYDLITLGHQQDFHVTPRDTVEKSLNNSVSMDIDKALNSSPSFHVEQNKVTPKNTDVIEHKSIDSKIKAFELGVPRSKELIVKDSFLYAGIGEIKIWPQIEKGKLLIDNLLCLDQYFNIVDLVKVSSIKIGEANNSIPAKRYDFFADNPLSKKVIDCEFAINLELNPHLKLPFVYNPDAKIHVLENIKEDELFTKDSELLNINFMNNDYNIQRHPGTGNFSINTSSGRFYFGAYICDPNGTPGSSMLCDSYTAIYRMGDFNGDGVLDFLVTAKNGYDLILSDPDTQYFVLNFNSPPC
ncbi:hypothetical protein M900_A0397 [Bacteriovorax sp. Seq25_V]|nr:hypothetical protein M900_A0397 [Bacteriovorax sp. Seq25_V]